MGYLDVCGAIIEYTVATLIVLAIVAGVCFALFWLWIIFLDWLEDR